MFCVQYSYPGFPVKLSLAGVYIMTIHKNIPPPEFFWNYSLFICELFCSHKGLYQTGKQNKYSFPLELLFFLFISSLFSFLPFPRFLHFFPFFSFFFKSSPPCPPSLIWQECISLIPGWSTLCLPMRSLSLRQTLMFWFSRTAVTSSAKSTSASECNIKTSYLGLG